MSSLFFTLLALAGVSLVAPSSAVPSQVQPQSSVSATGLMRVTKIQWDIDTAKLTGEGRSFLFPLPVEGYGQTLSYTVSGASKVALVER